MEIPIQPTTNVQSKHVTLIAGIVIAFVSTIAVACTPYTRHKV